MKVILSQPVAGLNGTHKRADIVYVTNECGTHARSRVRPFDPRTPAQMETRNKPLSARDLWQTLTPAQVRGWSAYRKLYNSVGHTALTGYDVFKSVAFRRQYNRLPPRVDPPLYPPPPPVESITLLPMVSPTTLAFTVDHHLGTNPEAILMTVKMTRPGRPAARPSPKALTLIGGRTGPSTIVLPASGGVAEFHNIRYEIPAGTTFWLEIVLWRPTESVASAPFFVELDRE